jgi:hypothetical protein
LGCCTIPRQSLHLMSFLLVTLCYSSSSRQLPPLPPPQPGAARRLPPSPRAGATTSPARPWDRRRCSPRWRSPRWRGPPPPRPAVRSTCPEEEVEGCRPLPCRSSIRTLLFRCLFPYGSLSQQCVVDPLSLDP